MYKTILFEKAPPRATILLNDPAVQNALSISMLGEIREALSEIEKDSEMIVCVISSVGEHYCSGIHIADVKDMDAMKARKIGKLLHQTFGEIRNLEKPVITAIRGNCLGAGLELALSCDFLIGSKNSQYGFPHMRIGIPSIVEAGILPQAVGIFRAKELYFTAKFWDGERAYREGLLYKCLEDEKIEGEVRDLAELLSGYSPLAMAIQKDICNKWMTTDLETAIDYSINSVGLSFSTQDQKEGMSAFLEKRKPEFKGE